MPTELPTPAQLNRSTKPNQARPNGRIGLHRAELGHLGNSDKHTWGVWRERGHGELTLACVAEELALFALIRQAQVLLELREEANDEQAWSDFRDLTFEDEDFLFLFNPELDGIEETEWARQHAVVGLKFSEWFRPFDPASHGIPHPFSLD